MGEKTLLALLARIVRQHLAHLDHEWTEEELDALGTGFADGAWNGLILLLRENLAQGDATSIEELGIFERRGEDYRFVPAASLAEAGALSLEPARGRELHVRRALFYLHEGLRLLEGVEGNPQVHSPGPPTPEEKLLRAIFDTGNDKPLSAELMSLSRLLAAQARTRDPKMPQLEPHIAKVTELGKPVGGHWVMPAEDQAEIEPEDA